MRPAVLSHPNILATEMLLPPNLSESLENPAKTFFSSQTRTFFLTSFPALEQANQLATSFQQSSHQGKQLTL
jgi:hypothetical protein